jgi:UPF0755 protein
MTVVQRIAIAATIACFGGAVWAGYTLYSPYGGFPSGKLVDIPRGTSTRGIASRLENEGVIRWQWQFMALRGLHPSVKLHAGEYEFTEPSPPVTVFDRIARGDVHYYVLSIPEGSNMFDVARAVSGLGFITRDDFLAAARDPSLIADLDPKAPSLEGYLYPSTYRLTRQTTAPQLCKQMTDQFRQAWSQLKSTRDVHETVTLASLVEKETGLAEERPLVASVFRNRLDQGYRLQCDPTTIYAALLESRYDGNIRRADLDSKHPYNTYKNDGLPPGPIANPSIASLKATLEPAATDYLFFVAKPGSRAHTFSATLREHSQAVDVYRRGIQELQAKPANGVGH